MLTLKAEWTGYCPKHKRYDPAKDGEGGIKAACAECYSLLYKYRMAVAAVGQTDGRIVTGKAGG